MTITAGMDDLRRGYETLRAQAIGEEVTAVTPRGLALFLRSGLTAWMVAWAPPGSAPAPTTPVPSTKQGRHEVLAGLSGELVRVLAEMAVSSQRRYCA